MLLCLGLAALLGGGPPADQRLPSSEAQARGIVLPSARRPTAVLLLTARTLGEIQPCGCHARPGGGLARRAGFAALVRRVWPDVPVVWLSAGDFSAPPGPAGHVRTAQVSRLMKEMGYVAANVGPWELAGGLEAYRRDVVSSGLPLISTNLEVRPDPTAEGSVQASMHAALQKVLPLGGLRIGVLGLTDLARPATAVRMREPAEAAEAAAAALRPGVDFLLALCAMPETRALDVAGAAPSLDLVYAGAGSRISPEPVQVGPVPVLFGGDRGLWVTEVRLYAGRRGLEAAEFVTHYLGEEVPEEARMLEEERDAAALVRQALRREAADGAAADPRREEEGGYVAAPVCGPCHPAAWAAWSGSRHARALATLAGQGKELDPSCLPCHVTGSGLPGGFANPLRDSPLAGVQCEACHGPGAGHVREPSRAWPVPEAPDSCTGCHDAENDPEFDLWRDWPRVAH
jgi:hypothetical protein